MIRTVAVPTTVSRMGCAPGGDCCDECRGHKSEPADAAALVIYTAPWSGKKNATLHSRLGQDLQCDQDGNCYSDGTLVSAPLTTGAGCAPGVASCAASTESIALWVGGGLIGAILLTTLLGGGGGRRRR